jgi:anaerobic magnesium-protoporphyrin IX monomethyl ester cyclase
LRFRDEAFRSYFTSTSYLDLVQKRFGEETLRHVRDMTTHRLERRFAP